MHRLWRIQLLQYCLSNSFIKFTYHKIHPFKYAVQWFLVCLQSCASISSTFRTLLFPAHHAVNTTLDPSGCHPSFSCPQPQATTNVLRVSVMFPALDTSCERTHNTQRSVAGRFYIRFSGLMFSMCPHFIPLYYCVDGCALFCVSRQQLMDSWSVSVFCVMNDLSPGRSCRSCCVGVCFTSLRSTPKTEWLGCVVLLGFTVCELPHWFSEWLPHVRPAGCV